MAFHLYRHYDANGVLLYVGQSVDPFRRLKQHQSASNGNWPVRAVAMKTETFETLEEVCRAEGAAIATEKPRFNISLKPKSKTVHTSLYVPAKAKKKLDQMAVDNDCKVHDHYLMALEGYLRAKGHAAEADEIANYLGWLPQLLKGA
jgi:hypothetical protein